MGLGIGAIFSASLRLEFVGREAGAFGARGAPTTACVRVHCKGLRESSVFSQQAAAGASAEPSPPDAASVRRLGDICSLLRINFRQRKMQSAKLCVPFFGWYVIYLFVLEGAESVEAMVEASRDRKKPPTCVQMKYKMASWWPANGYR